MKNKISIAKIIYLISMLLIHLSVSYLIFMFGYAFAHLLTAPISIGIAVGSAFVGIYLYCINPFI